MIWNHRIIHHDNVANSYFALHEVFYDEKGKIEYWTTDPVDISGENPTEIVALLKQMLADSQTAVLSLTDLEKRFNKSAKRQLSDKR